MAYSDILRTKGASYFIKSLPFFTLTNETIFGITIISNLSIFFQIPVLSIFIYEFSTQIIMKLEKDPKRKKSFFKENTTIKIVVLLISFYFMIGFSSVFPKFSYRGRSRLLTIPKIPTFTILQGLTIGLFSLLTLGALVGFYVYVKDGNIDFHIAITRSWDGMRKEKAEIISELNTESRIYNKVSFYTYILVAGMTVILLSILLGFILYIFVSISLLVLILSLGWISYDLINKEKIGNFNIKDYFKFASKNYSKTENLFLDFKILKYGFNGIIKSMFIVSGMFSTIVFFFLFRTGFLLFFSYTLPRIFEYGFDAGRLIFILNFFGTFLIIPFMIVIIGLIIWVALLKRAKYWLNPQMNKMDSINKVTCFPKYSEIFFPVSIIAWILRINFRAGLSDRIFPLLITLFIIFLLFYFTKYSLKTLKTRKRTKKSKIKVDNYRIITFFVFLSLSFVLMGRFREITEIKIYRVLKDLYLFIPLVLFYFLQDFSEATNKLSTKKIKRNILENTYSSLLVLFLCHSIFLISDNYFILILGIIIIFLLFLGTYLNNVFAK